MNKDLAAYRMTLGLTPGEVRFFTLHLLRLGLGNFGLRTALLREVREEEGAMFTQPPKVPKPFAAGFSTSVAEQRGL